MLCLRGYGYCGMLTDLSSRLKIDHVGTYPVSVKTIP